MLRLSKIVLDVLAPIMKHLGLVRKELRRIFMKMHQFGHKIKNTGFPFFGCRED